jgi:hypothetical protein
VITNVATDTFGRTVTSGWGSATSGQPWTATGAGGTVSGTDSSVSSGVGKHSVPIAAAYRFTYLSTLSLVDVDAQVTGSVAAVPTGAPLEIANLMLRGTSVAIYNLIRTQVEIDASVTVHTYGHSGVPIGSATVPGITYTGGMQITVEAQAIGTTIRVRVWQASTIRPPLWLITTTDITVPAAGWVGCRSGIAASNTNTKPVVFSYDNFLVGSPTTTDFPDEDLELLVYAAFDADRAADPYTWQYTDISPWLLDDTVTVSDGRSDGATTTSPATASVPLDNNDARFTKGNPLSPHWPGVRKGCPVLILVNPDVAPNPVLLDGDADGWSPAWDVYAQKATVTLSASGVSRRLSQGSEALHSPLYRALLASDAVAYWPIEDGVDATHASSPISGVGYLSVSDLSFGADSGLAGSASLPTFGSDGSITGRMPADSTFHGHWQVDWYYKIATAPAVLTPIMSIESTGTATRWDVALSTGAVAVSARAGATSIVLNNSVPVQMVGQFVHIRLMVRQTGGNVDWQLVWIPLPGSGGFFYGGSYAGTCGQPSRTFVDVDTALQGMAVGHLSVFDGYNIGAADDAEDGWVGETTIERIQRLCDEQGVDLETTGMTTVTMGPQGIDSFMHLVQDAESAEVGGMLYDNTTRGLRFSTLNSRYNRPSVLTLDYGDIKISDDVSDSQVLPPADDDQQLHNYVRVERSKGSSAVAEDVDGPSGTAAIGIYDSGTVTVNVDTDDVLPNIASWLVHVGTTEDLRYPQLPVDFAANPDLIPAWQALRMLDPITLTGMPAQHPPGDVDISVQGRSQKLGRRRWSATLNCSPQGPYSVWALGSLATGRVDSAGTTVRTTVAAGATSMQVNVPGRVWTTNASYLPLYLRIDGIKVKVTNITGASSPQTLTVDPTTVTKILTAGQPVHLWQPAIVAL